VNIITSQKIWMDTTLAFFIVLSIYLFTYAYKKEKHVLFLLSGLAGGCAVLTKYPGILPVIILILFAISYDRKLLKNRFFISGICISFLFLLPWFWLNYQVYGSEFIAEHTSAQKLKLTSPRVIILITFLIIGTLIFIESLLKDSSQHKLELTKIDNRFGWLRSVLTIGCGLLLLYSQREEVLSIFLMTHFPSVTWRQGLFVGEPPTFYIGRMIEWSGLFLFSFASFFLLTDEDSDRKIILFLSAGVILIFFMVWGSFQSRYILPAIPFLIIMAVILWKEMFDRCTKSESALIYMGGRLTLRLFMCVIIVKAVYLNYHLSFPNDMCYY